MNLKRFNKIWPRLGGGLAVIIFIAVGWTWAKNPSVSPLPLLYWLNLAILMLHEFEEYVFPGGFKEFANTKTFFSMPDSSPTKTISEKLIVSINLGIWVVMIIGALMANIAPWLGLGMIIFNFINIFGHLIIFQKKVKGYNPGMVTAFLMIPFLTKTKIIY